MSTRLDKLEIHTWVGEFAPRAQRWHACLREYDQGSKVFTGPDQRAAINELLDHYERDNGELHE